MSELNTKVSACLDKFYALKARCEGKENLHALGNEAESILNSVSNLLSTMPALEKSVQMTTVERKLMVETRKGSAKWRHVANFTLERFRLLKSD